MGLLEEFASFAKTPEGIGLLSTVAGGLAGARKGQPINSLGRAGMSGLMGYAQAQDQQMQQEQAGQMKDLRSMQIGQMKQAQIDAARRQEKIAAYRDSLPEQDRSMFDLSPDSYLKNITEVHSLPEGGRLVQNGKTIAEGGPKLPPGMRMNQATGMPEYIPEYLSGQKDIRAAGRSVNNSIVKLPAMETEEQKALGKDLADQYSTTQKTSISSSAMINKLTRAEQLMQGINTGKLAPAANEVAAVFDSLGMKYDDKLPQKQAFAALTNELALRAKNQGGENLMPGAMSNPDREFLQQMSPSMSNTPEGNRLIIETNKRLAKRDVEIGKMAREYRNKNKTLNGFADELAAYSEKNPLFADLAQSAKPAGGGFKIIGVR